MTTENLAEDINKIYQEINNPIDWKTGKQQIYAWTKLPLTTRFVWRKFAETLIKQEIVIGDIEKTGGDK